MQAVTEMKNSTDQYKVIGICTSHIQQEDCDRLRVLGEDPSVGMILSRDSGAFVKLYTDEPDDVRILEEDYPGFSPAFYNVLGQAKQAGYEMVEFDEAATEYESLPVFNW